MIFAAILLAYFTNPKESDFTSFIQPELRNAPSGPIIEYKNRFVYSTATITYYNTISEKGKLMANAAKVNYIGLLGRFWKLND